MLRLVNPSSSPKVIGPFSHGVVASGHFLFVAGQGPQDAATGGFRLGDFEDEVRLTMLNMHQVLSEAGCDWSHVVRVGVYLTKREHFTRFNAIYSEVFGDNKPARTTIICDLLADIQVEMDCIALVPGES
jgi:2-iminobutanoate/2-iminopropanoate deaminase